MLSIENENLKLQNEEGNPIAISILTALMAFFPLILKGVTPTYYLPAISILAIVLFIILTYKTLTNVATFAILLFLISVVFPLIHFSVYQINKNNYKFEGDFLAKKTKELEEQTANHIEVELLKKILIRKDSILDVPLDKLSENNIYKVGNNLIRIDLMRRPDESIPYIILYDSKGVRLGDVKATDNTMKKCFVKEKNFLHNVIISANNPSEYIFANDFWIESITAFTFGNIKANSNLVIGIRAIQYIASFIFLTMLTNTLSAMDSFIMKRKK